MTSLARRLARKAYAEQVMRLKHAEQISSQIDEQAETIIAIFEAVAARIENGTAVERPMPGDDALLRGAEALLNTWAFGSPERSRRIQNLFNRMAIREARK